MTSYTKAFNSITSTGQKFQLTPALQAFFHFHWTEHSAGLLNAAVHRRWEQDTTSTFRLRSNRRPGWRSIFPIPARDYRVFTPEVYSLTVTLQERRAFFNFQERF